MGNSHNGSLRQVITEGDDATLWRMIQEDGASEYMNLPLNRKGDSVLILACRLGRDECVSKLLEHGGCDLNAVNRENNTALDVALDKCLPPDGDILHHHFCPYSSVETKPFVIPTVIKHLLKAGARGKSLDRLILYCMKQEHLVTEIIDLLNDLISADQFRTNGLLLQVAVWFDQYENLEILLKRGIDVENFWKTSFMPKIQPSSYHRSVQWPRGEAAEYILGTIPDSDAVQSLKFSFIQDWRVDWNEGENPSAQYRAGLQLTPDSAILFTRAANHYRVLVRVMSDVLSYLPTVCSGPDLRQSHLIQCLTMAGYSFSPEEIQHLNLKFNLDFTSYQSFQADPRPLKHLARLCFRQHLKKNVFHCLEQLDYLPETVKGYLTLADTVA